MVKEDLVKKFLENNSYLRNGAKYLADRWNTTINDIVDSKNETRRRKNSYELGNNNLERKDFINEIIGEEDNRITGDKIIDYKSDKPLSPEELDKLVGVDNINTYVSYTWLKSHKNGIWTYSVAVKKRIADFYNQEELKEKLKELFPEITPFTLPPTDSDLSGMLTILLSDDHAGAANNPNSLYGNTWTPEKYKERLLEVSDRVKNGVPCEEIHIISLGDQMNGWNSQTTRGGHTVNSLSNNEQFDAYIKGRVAFYNDLFSSGISEKYVIHEVENSNHSGLGMSYMANQYLKLYIENKFPQVQLISHVKFLEYFTYGVHTIGFAHGKDEKLMSRPMPFKLDEKTEVFLMQYFADKGITFKNSNITFYKGDLHQYNITGGKFGRYINIPSILGSTDYSELNFGDTKPGALIEFFSKDENIIISMPVWFKN